MSLIITCAKPERRPALAVDADTARLGRLMEASIAAAFAVPLDELRAPARRCATVAFARQSAMYLAHVVLGLNYSMTGALFQRDRTTAAYACQLVEDRRDDPAIDQLLQTLEQACRDLARGNLESPPVRP